MLKPYDEYKKTDISWLKSIPKHWTTQRAKYLYKKQNIPALEDDEVITCFRDGQVTLRKNRRTTGFTESIKEIGYQHIEKGDLVIHVMDAFAGAVGVSDSSGKSTPVYSVCTPKKDLNNFYYAFIVREMAKLGYIQSLYRGIRERSSDFRFEVFSSQVLPVPPLEEQNQIVRYLDWQVSKINKLIKAKKKQITLLNEQKQAVINKAVTKGLDDSVPMKDSGIEWFGEIPENWKVGRLKNLCILQRGHDLTSVEFVEGKIPVYGSNGVIGYHNKVTTNAPNITIGRSGSVGKLNLINEDFWAHNTAIYIKNLKNNSCDYLFYILSTLDMDKLSTKTAVPTLDRKNVQESVIVYTNNILEQEKIVHYLQYTIYKIELLSKKIKNQIDMLTEYKTTLISSVVTGKVDVRNITIPNFEPEDFTEDPEQQDEDQTNDLEESEE